MIDSHLSTPLFGVQKEALRLSKDRQGFGFWMEQGLGKSLVTLAEYTNYLFEDKVDGWVVACPNTLKENWKLEAEKHGANLNVYIWPDDFKKLHPSKLKERFLLAVNYEALGVGQAGKFMEELFPTCRVGFTLDESVQIKNPRSDRGAECQYLGRMAAFTRCLSGKPQVQGPQDMWAPLVFTKAIEAKEMLYSAFKARYCKRGGYKGQQIIGVANEEELNSIILAHGFRAKKKDWLDIPDKLPQIRKVELSAVQKEHYQELAEEFFTIVNGSEISPAMTITQLLKLQQIVSGFVIDDNRKVQRIVEKIPKMEELVEIIDESPGKVIVVAYFSESIELLRKRLAHLNPAIIQGEQKMDKDTSVEKEKAKFNLDPSCRVIIVQTSSAKYGHTLLGDTTSPDSSNKCSTTIFYENSFSLDDRVQMEDRNHRIGQTLPVSLFDFVTSPIDTRIIRALQRKELLSQAVLDFRKN